MKFLFTALLVSALGFAASAADFEAIAADEIPQTPTKISIPGDCSCGSTFPPTMYTIETADSVTISTNPPGLVTNVRDEDGVLKFTFAPEADGLESGGIKIGMPANQLTQVKANSGKKVQILNGFTSVDLLEANGASEIIADLSSNTATTTTATTTPITLYLNGASSATIVSSSEFGGGVLNGASSAYISSPRVSNFVLNGASRMEVDGAVEGASLNGASSMIVSGDIQGLRSTLNGASSAQAASCPSDINLFGASSCEATSPSVTVTVTEQDAMGSGSGGFFGGPEQCWSWDCGFWSSSPSIFSIRAAGIATAAAAAVAGVCLAM